MITNRQESKCKVTKEPLPEVHELVDEELALSLKALLDGRYGIGMRKDSILMPDFISKKETNILFGEIKIKVIPVYGLNFPNNVSFLEFLSNHASDWFTDPQYRTETNCLAIFDLTKLSPNASLRIKVPPGSITMYIGEGGWQIREWCQKLNLSHIDFFA